MEERCLKYPSMLKIYCSHCQGGQLGPQGKPIFSLKEDFDDAHGCPVVEVLKNGGPVHMWDRHFRFGLRKAQMLLACIKVLEDFGWSTESERLLFRPRIVEDQRQCLRVQIYVEMHPDFEYSMGARIERPWLRLQAMPPDTARLGLGTMKCRAVWGIREALREWVERQTRLGERAIERPLSEGSGL